jgi:alkylation response protein AidB-like acyl-CoA dehydrogenase
VSQVSTEQLTDLEELRATVRRFLAARAPMSEVRRVIGTGQGYDPGTWATMASQLGLPGLPFPEELGGAGATWTEVAVVLEELGRALLPSPYLASVVLAGTAIATSGDGAARKELLPPIATGEVTATLAMLEDDGRWDASSAGLTAVRAGDAYRLDGYKTFVLDGHLADLVIVAARTGSGASLFAVAGNSPGLRRTALPTLDQTRPQARLEFAGVPAQLLGGEGQARPALARTFDLALVAVAAEGLGGAQRCLEMSLAYARERIAFGRPIGAFQAIKHKLADLFAEIEFARSAVEHAALAAEQDSTELPLLASLAAAHCAQTYTLAATENIHIHGGIGFTWEHDAQLFFKRAKSSQALFGDAAFHRERIAAQLLDDGAGSVRDLSGHASPPREERRSPW